MGPTAVFTALQSAWFPLATLPPSQHHHLPLSQTRATSSWLSAVCHRSSLNGHVHLPNGAGVCFSSPFSPSRLHLAMRSFSTHRSEWTSGMQLLSCQVAPHCPGLQAKSLTTPGTQLSSGPTDFSALITASPSPHHCHQGLVLSCREGTGLCLPFSLAVHVLSTHSFPPSFS